MEQWDHKVPHTNTELASAALLTLESDLQLASLKTFKKIGRGEQARVYEPRPDSVYVLKEVHVLARFVPNVLREVCMTAEAERIAPRIYRVCTTRSKRGQATVRIAMEKMQPYRDTSANAKEVVSLVERLVCDKGIVHNDLHMANIMCDKTGRARLVDFEYSRKLAELVPDPPHSLFTPTEWSQLVCGQLSFLVFVCNENNGGYSDMSCGERALHARRKHFVLLRAHVKRTIAKRMRSCPVATHPRQNLPPVVKLLLVQALLMHRGRECPFNERDAVGASREEDFAYRIWECVSAHPDGTESATDLWDEVRTHCFTDASTKDETNTKQRRPSTRAHAAQCA